MGFKMNKKGFPMNSPSKNYKNPRDYRVFNMGNEADPPLDMGKKEGGPAYMKSPVKKEFEKQRKSDTSARLRSIRSKGGPEAKGFEKSGFKMKEGSPFQRNFGVGASPVKAHPSKELDRLKDDVTTFQKQHDENPNEKTKKDLDWAKQAL